MGAGALARHAARLEPVPHAAGHSGCAGAAMGSGPRSQLSRIPASHRNQRCRACGGPGPRGRCSLRGQGLDDRSSREGSSAWTRGQGARVPQCQGSPRRACGRRARCGMALALLYILRPQATPVPVGSSRRAYNSGHHPGGCRVAVAAPDSRVTLTVTTRVTLTVTTPSAGCPQGRHPAAGSG
jgi:hypothetical protein